MKLTRFVEFPSILLLLLLVSESAPTDAFGFDNTLTDEKGTARAFDVQSCSGFSVTYAYAYPDKRSYHFQGSCFLVGYSELSGGVSAKVSVFAEYDRVNKRAKESGYFTFNHPMVGQQQMRLRADGQSDINYLCDDDPWLRGGNCQSSNLGSSPQIGDNNSTGSAGNIIMGRFVAPNPPLPITRGAMAAIHAYIDEKFIVKGAAPRIVSPKKGESYQAGSLIVDVEPAPPNLVHWQKSFTYPPEASNVVLVWERWDPKIKDWVGANLLDSISITGGVDVLTTTAHEGKWRVKGKHNVPSWTGSGTPPWSSWVEFWIGDPTNYGHSNDFDIVSPTPGKEYAVKDQQGLYPVEFQVGHSLKRSIEVQYDRYDETSVTQRGWGSIKQNDQNLCCRMVNEPWTLHLEPGWWAMRVRWKKFRWWNMEAPWTDWVRFWAGPKHDVYAILQLGDPSAVNPPSTEKNSSLESNPKRASSVDSSGAGAKRAQFGEAIGAKEGGRASQSITNAGDVARANRSAFGAARRDVQAGNSEQAAPKRSSAIESSGRLNSRQQIASVPGIAVISPRSGQIVRGDLVVRIAGNTGGVNDLAVSFEKRVGNSWREQSFGQLSRMSPRSGALMVPRRNFREGGRWRVCVHPVGTTCAVSNWSEFTVAAIGDQKPGGLTDSDVRLRSADPSLVGKPRDGGSPQVGDPATPRVPAPNDATRAPSLPPPTQPRTADKPAIIELRPRQ